MQSPRESGHFTPREKRGRKGAVVSGAFATGGEHLPRWKHLPLVLLVLLGVFGTIPAVAQTKDIPTAPAVVAVTTDAFLNSLSEGEHNGLPAHPIIRVAQDPSWPPIYYAFGFNYTRLWQIAALSTVVLLGLIAWNWKLAREIKDRKQAEEALRVSAEKFRVVQELMPDGFTILRPVRDAQGCVVDFTWVFQNAVVARLNGTDSQAVIGRRLLDLFPGHRGTHFLDVYQRVAETQKSCVFEDWYQGETITNPIWFRIAVVPTCGDIAILAQNITERKQAEISLRRTDRALRMISECNQVLVRATAEVDLLQSICRIVVEHGGYRMAWVGFAEPNEAKSVRPVAQAGFETGYLDTVNITWADTERGRGPTGTAIRTGQPVIARDIPTAPDYGPWRAEAIQRGYVSSVTFPLMNGERAFGALMVYAAESDAFHAEEMTLLAELASDLAYGITALRTRAEREQAEKALQESNDRLAAVMENLSEGLIMADDQGRTVYWNPAALAMCGYASMDDCQRNLAEFADTFEFRPLHEDRLLPVEDWPMSRVLRGEALHDWEVRLRRLDQGWERILAYSGWIIRSASGEKLAFVSATDNTERKRQKESLRQKAEALRASNVELEQFNSAMIGRELRMIELKREINELCGRMGEPPRHQTKQLPADRLHGDSPAPEPVDGGGA